MWLEEALRAFAAIVDPEVDGAEGDGQLSTELGNMDGEEGWRLVLVRLRSNWWSRSRYQRPKLPVWCGRADQGGARCPVYEHWQWRRS